MYQTKGNNPPRLDFWEWMIYVLFAGTSFLVGLVVYCIGKSFAWPVRRLIDRVRGEKVATEEKTEEVTEVAPMAAPEDNSAKAPLVDWDEPEIVAAEIRRIELEKGYVVFRLNEQTGVAKGKLTVTSKVLHKAIGKTVLLNLDHCASIADAISIMRGKAEAILASAAVKKTVVSKTAKASSVPDPLEKSTPSEMDVPPMMDMPFEDIPVERLEDIPPYFFDQEEARTHEPDMGDPFDQFVAPEAPKKAAAPNLKKKAPPKNAKAKYRGILLSYGQELRTLDDPKKGKHQVHHFCVRIHDEVLDAEHPLWGNDLERVIREANVQVGDRVDLAFVGWTTVEIHGKSEQKKIWALSKI